MKDTTHTYFSCYLHFWLLLQINRGHFSYHLLCTVAYCLTYMLIRKTVVIFATHGIPLNNIKN